jgi:hypothetical protein
LKLEESICTLRIDQGTNQLAIQNSSEKYHLLYVANQQLQKNQQNLLEKSSALVTKLIKFGDTWNKSEIVIEN